MQACPLVSVVIPTFNNKDSLLQCLKSLTVSSYKNIEIIVVDNGSTDGTSEAVKQYFPEVKLITLNENTGVTGGRNTGAKVAKGEFILFLDHDMVADKEMIKILVEIMQKNANIGISGPVIYYYDEPEKIWAAGTSINMLTGKISFNNVMSSDEYFEVQVMPAAIMVRRDVLRRVGLFDDTFFATYEDTDLCFRIRKAGYKVVCVPKAKSWHKLPSTEELQDLRLLNRAFFIARNRIIFMRKHAKAWQFAVFLTFFVPIYAIYYMFLALRRFQLKSIIKYWEGILAGLRYMMRS